MLDYPVHICLLYLAIFISGRRDTLVLTNTQEYVDTLAEGKADLYSTFPAVQNTNIWSGFVFVMKQPSSGFDTYNDCSSKSQGGARFAFCSLWILLGTNPDNYQRLVINY